MTGQTGASRAAGRRAAGIDRSRRRLIRTGGLAVLGLACRRPLAGAFAPLAALAADGPDGSGDGSRRTAGHRPVGGGLETYQGLGGVRVSEFRDRLKQRYERAKDDAERGKRDASRRAANKGGTRSALLKVVEERSQDAAGAGLGLKVDDPSPGVYEISRGSGRDRLTLRLSLVHDNTTLRWERLEQNKLEDSGFFDLADPEQAIETAIAEYVEWLGRTDAA